MSFILLILLSIPLACYADSELKLLKLFSDGQQLVLPKVEGLESGSIIKVKDKQSLQLYEAKVVVCKAKSCLAKLTEKSHRLNSQAQYVVPYTRPAFRKTSAYLGFGSPQGPAIRGGVRNGFKSWGSVGANFGLVRSSTKSVNINSKMFTALLGYNLYQKGKFKFNLNAEFGYAMCEMEFTSRSDGPTIKENALIGSLAIEPLYFIGHWGMGLNLGLSKSTLKNSYTSDGYSYSNPYSKILMFTEVGLHYLF
ncbi:MAG: hypothetical protein AB7I27_10230 [Bacteriovoracaceae bacterium]